MTFRFLCCIACGFESHYPHQLALTKKMQAKIKKLKAIKNNFLTFEKSWGVK